MSFDAGAIEATLTLNRTLFQAQIAQELAQYRALKAEMEKGVTVPVKFDQRGVVASAAAGQIDRSLIGKDLGLIGSDPALLKRLEMDAAQPGGIGIIGVGNDSYLRMLLRRALQNAADPARPPALFGTGGQGTDIQKVVQQVVRSAEAAPTTQMVFQKVVGGAPEARGVPWVIPGLTDLMQTNDVGQLKAALTALAQAAAGGSLAVTSVAKAAAANEHPVLAAAGATNKWANAITSGMPLWDRTAGGIGRVNGAAQLFGGQLTRLGIPAVLATAGAVHLLIDSMVEIGGTLLPAAIAFTAFGVAAIPTATDLWKQLQSANSASQALGANVYPLTGGFQNLAQAVQPSVYVLFGEGLDLINKKTGTFTTIATGAGHVLDGLGARFVYAITNGNSFNNFMSHSVADLAGWGNLIGNIGGTIGNILKVLPGYAEVILNILQSVSHGIEIVTGSPLGQWLLKVGLAAHGAVLYIGLLATAFAFLATRGLQAVDSLLATSAVKLLDMGGAAKVAGTAVAAMSDSVAAASEAPWGFIGVAAAAFGLLIYQIVTAKSVAQQFAASVQQNLGNVPLTNLVAASRSEIRALSGDLGPAEAALRKFSAANQQLVHSIATSPRDITTQRLQLFQLQTNVQGYQLAIKQVGKDQQVVNKHISEAAGLFGGTSNAWAILNAAGITSAQILNDNKQQWAEALIEAQGYFDTLKIGVTTSGQAAAAFNALNFAAGDSRNALGQIDSDMTTVTQAESQMFTTLISGEQAFITFAQNLNTVHTNAHAVGATLGGLNAQSLTLASSFYSTLLPSAEALINALQMQDASASNLTKAIATEAAQMLPYAKGNTAAQVAIVDLINNALGPGTVSLQTLSKWTAANSTTMSGFSSIVATTQINASHLAGALQQDLNVMFQQALLKTSGADKAMQQYAYDLTHAGTSIATTQGARSQLIRDLEAAGFSAQQATTYVNGLQKQIDQMHGKNVGVGVIGTGEFNAIQVANPTVAGLIAKEAAISRGFAAGTMGAPSGWAWVGEQGKELVNFSGGETVIPNHMLGGYSRGTPDAIPSLIFGLTGNDTKQAVELGLATLMVSAISSLTAKGMRNVAALNIPGIAGPGGGGILANMLLAMHLMPAWSKGAEWAAWDALWMRESGWNQYARNPSSGAYGIPQALPPGKMGASANPPYNNVRAQETWGIGYILGRYGDPINAWSHEMRYGWYDHAGQGKLPQGWSMAYNGTGRAEVMAPDGLTAMFNQLCLMTRQLDALIGTVKKSSYATGQAVGQALAGAGRSAVNGAIYNG